MRWFALLSIVFVGCAGHGGDAATATAAADDASVTSSGPPALKLVDASHRVGHVFHCSGPYCDGEVGVSDDDGKVRLAASGPPGETVVFAGTTIRLSAAGTGTLVYDPAQHLAEIPIAEVMDHPSNQLEVPVKLTAGSTLDGVVGLPYQVFETALRKTIDTIDHGPIHVDGDTPAPAKPRSLVFLWAPNSKFFGDPKATLRDLDLIARYSTKPRAAGTCGPYEKVGTVNLFRYDAEVTVYDRRTGNVAYKQLIVVPPRRCPKSIIGEEANYGGTTITSGSAAQYVEPTAIHAWLATLVPE